MQRPASLYFLFLSSSSLHTGCINSRIMLVENFYSHVKRDAILETFWLKVKILFLEMKSSYRSSWDPQQLFFPVYSLRPKMTAFLVMNLDKHLFRYIARNTLFSGRREFTDCLLCDYYVLFLCQARYFPGWKLYLRCLMRGDPGYLTDHDKVRFLGSGHALASSAWLQARFASVLVCGGSPRWSRRRTGRATV